MASIQSTNTQIFTPIEIEIAKFNKALEEHPIISEELIDNISKIVEDEMTRLRKYLAESHAFEEAITDKRWCSRTICCSALSKQVWLLFVSNFIGNAILFAISSLDNDFSTRQKIGIGAAGVLFNAGCFAYGFRVSSNVESTKKLKTLNEKGLENITKFHTFLKKWKESEKRAKELLAKIQEGQRQLAVPTSRVVVHVDITDLHKSIGECLQAYDCLSPEYRTDQVFARLAPHLIAQLPEEDELHKELRKLEPSADAPEDIEANAPLPYQYYRSDSVRRMSQFYGEQDSKGEATPLISDTPSIRTEFAKEVSFVRNKIMEKYGLKNFPYYFEMPKGWQVDKHGIRRTRYLVERRDSASLSALEPLPVSPSGRLSPISPITPRPAPLNVDSSVLSGAPATPHTPRHPTLPLSLSLSSIPRQDPVSPTAPKSPHTPRPTAMNLTNASAFPASSLDASSSSPALQQDNAQADELQLTDVRVVEDIEIPPPPV